MRPAWKALAGTIVLLIAGCGGGSTASQQSASTHPPAGPVAEPTGPVTITFASWVGNEPVIQSLARKFHSQHPNITVKFQNVPAEEATQKLTTQIAGGNAPDAAYVDASTVAAFASRGALTQLDDYIARGRGIDPKDYVPAFKTSTVYKGKMYGLPFDGESTGLFYRTDLFAAAGITAPPRTWEEFQADAARLTQPDKKQYGYILFAPESAYYWYPWLWQNGGQLLNEDGTAAAFNSDKAKTAASFYVGLAKYSPKDFLNSNSYDGRVAFATGKVAMYMAGAWFAGVLDGEFPKIKGKWAAAPLPEGPAGCATTVAGDSLVMFSGGKNQDAAWKWLEFLSQPENIALWTYKSKGSTLLPPRTSLLESSDLTAQKPILKGFADQMKCGVSNVIANPKWPKVEDKLNQDLGKAFYGDESVSDALDHAAQQADQILRH
ncbi:ABC transporter substrate-binding protein [Pedococcus sp. 5OH_020]|uniref:ABC transporter substrate-binding protein n=1 Tax=Pedococcus sp. 5OH_020 TaxID=2989814 RepID=UPI0022E99D17|nr:sugar ABC transporter substrate-binding protein [Pedococcus sp. 5OH_020]